MKDYAPEEKAILKQLEDGLSPNLHYHGLHHTRDVMEAALRIASSEGLPEDQIRLLRIAVLYHDSGFVVNSKDHESHGCEIAKRNLPAYGYSPKEIETICGMIMATRIPQSPHNLLEKIICDADLDYLGRDDFNRISRSLYEEIKLSGQNLGERDWNLLQKKFLENHHYFTEFGKKNREPLKQQHLRKINDLLAQLA